MKPPILVAIAAFASLAFAQQKTGAQQVIEKQMTTYSRAMESKDMKGVMGIFAPTYSTTDLKGVTYSRDRVVIQLRSLFATAKKIHITTTIKTFKLANGEAHITCHDILDVEVPDGAGKLSKYRSDSVSDETWVAINATWKIKSAKVVSEKRTIDGKPE